MFLTWCTLPHAVVVVWSEPHLPKSLKRCQYVSIYVPVFLFVSWVLSFPLPVFSFFCGDVCVRVRPVLATGSDTGSGDRFWRLVLGTGSITVLALVSEP